MRRLVVLLTISLLLSGCYSLGLGTYLDFELHREHPYADSIEVEVSLSDTTVHIYRPSGAEIWYTPPAYFPQVTESIYVTVKIKNASAIKLRLPKESGATPCTIYGEDKTIVYIGGREGDSTHISCLSARHGLGRNLYPDYFAPLSAGAERLVLDSLDLFQGGMFPVDEPGKFWVLVKFQNYMWKESKTPYWTGAVWSDTLWFNIIE